MTKYTIIFFATQLSKANEIEAKKKIFFFQSHYMKKL